MAADFVSGCNACMVSAVPWKGTGRSFPFADKVVPSVKTMIDRGAFFKDIASSMSCVGAGFGLGFITSLPVAFLMAWYTPVQKIIEPWINFIRNIPALAYAPLLVITFGVGQKPAIILIWICTFMTMSITIYQGIRNIDVTLIKLQECLEPTISRFLPRLSVRQLFHLLSPLSDLDLEQPLLLCLQQSLQEHRLVSE